MKIFAETERLILREIVSDDAEAFFEMDADPEVHRFLGNNPVKTIEQTKEAIQRIRSQYDTFNIGRWAAIEKSSGRFVGWTGLKYITEPKNGKVNFYDVGYRLNKKYWGKGYATESAKASLQYGFEQLGLKEIIGTAHVDNHASRKALLKCGLKYVETFDYPLGFKCDWFKITCEDWQGKTT
jgi:[ribosomal protein S5]-alanine N-acetyltransferase